MQLAHRSNNDECIPSMTEGLNIMNLREYLPTNTSASEEVSTKSGLKVDTHAIMKHTTLL